MSRPASGSEFFYLIVGMAGFYGLLISGTRSAIAVPIAGLGLFLFLSKSWKIGIISFILLVGGVGMLKYTKIGESNKLIRRMRSAFDTEDQSMMARFENQKALNAYMDEMPFGIGMAVRSARTSSIQHMSYQRPNFWAQRSKAPTRRYPIWAWKS